MKEIADKIKEIKKWRQEMFPDATVELYFLKNYLRSVIFLLLWKDCLPSVEFACKVQI